MADHTSRTLRELGSSNPATPALGEFVAKHQIFADWTVDRFVDDLNDAGHPRFGVGALDELADLAILAHAEGREGRREGGSESIWDRMATTSIGDLLGAHEGDGPLMHALDCNPTLKAMPIAEVFLNRRSVIASLRTIDNDLSKSLVDRIVSWRTAMDASYCEPLGLVEHRPSGFVVEYGTAVLGGPAFTPLARVLFRIEPAFREALIRREGLVDGKMKSFKEVGREIGVSASSASKRVEAAYGQMRDAKFRSDLDEYLSERRFDIWQTIANHNGIAAEHTVRTWMNSVDRRDRVAIAARYGLEFRLTSWLQDYARPSLAGWTLASPIRNDVVADNVIPEEDLDAFLAPS